MYHSESKGHLLLWYLGRIKALFCMNPSSCICQMMMFWECPSWADKYRVLSLGLSSTSWHLGFIIAGWWMSWPEIVFNVSVPKLEPPASLQCCHQLIHPLLRCKFHGQLWVCSIHSNNASGEHTRPSLCPLCLIVLTPWCIMTYHLT